MAAVVAFALMEISQQVLPGHRLTLLVVGAMIGGGDAREVVVLGAEGPWCAAFVPAGRVASVPSGDPLPVLGYGLEDVSSASFVQMNRLDSLFYSLIHLRMSSSSPVTL